MKMILRFLLLCLAFLNLTVVTASAQDAIRKPAKILKAKINSVSSKVASKTPLSVSESWHDEIDKALAQTTTFDFVDCPLKDALEQLSTDHGVHFEIDKTAIEDAGYNVELPITGAGKKRTLRSALNIMFDQYGIEFVHWNHSVLVTTRNAISNRPEKYLYYVLYDVSDLIDEKPEEFVKVIQRTIRPQSWLDTNGGPASISIVNARKKIILTVMQSSNGQHDVAQYLAALRKIAKN